MKVLRTFERWLTRTEEGLVVALLVFMVCLAFLQVVLRNVFSSTHLGFLQSILKSMGFTGGILWAESLLKYLVLWVGLLGAMLAAASDHQFAMDLTQRVLKGRARSVVASICHVFSAAVSAVLAWASLDFWKGEYADKSPLFSIGTFKMPAWVFEVILPGGFALLAIHYVIKIFDSWTPEELREGTELPGHLAGPAHHDG